MGLKRRVEAVLGLPLFGLRPLGCEQGDHADRLEVGLQIAAVGVLSGGHAEAVDDRLGRGPGIDRDTVPVGIGGIQIIGGKTVELKFRPIFHLGNACPEILQADDLRVLAIEPLEQAACRRLKYTVTG